MLKKLIVALGVTTPVLLAGNVLAATLPNLTPGSQFRYVFVTSGARNATSTDINTYNTFVNNEASAGSETSGITGPWTAIASTASISARTNTATTATGGVPIYRVDGTLVAHNYGDLWDGSIANPINVTQDDENVPTGTFVWTGTTSTGSTDSNPLGVATSRYGVATATNTGWIGSANRNSSTNQRLYAMSSIQEIPAAIPEPTTIIASLLVGAGLLPLKRRKSKKTK